MHVCCIVLHFIGDCLWMELPFIKNCTKSLRSVFPVVGYAYTNVSTYPCGQIGFLLAGKDKVFYFISLCLCFWHCFVCFCNTIQVDVHTIQYVVMQAEPYINNIAIVSSSCKLNFIINVGFNLISSQKTTFITRRKPGISTAL